MTNMNKFIIATLLATVLTTFRAMAYEPYGTDISLQFGGGVSAVNVFDANTLSRSYAVGLRNYDIQFKVFPTDHLGLFARMTEMGNGNDAESVFSCNPFTFGALYRVQSDRWDFQVGGGAGFGNPSDYSMISRKAEGAAPEFVIAGNSAHNIFALDAQIEASYHISDFLYVFSNLSVYAYPGNYSVIASYYDTDETWSGAVKYLSGDIQSRDWQPKFCTNSINVKSSAGVNAMFSIGIGFSFSK